MHLSKAAVVKLLAPLALCFFLVGCVNSEVSSVISEIDELGEITIESQDALESANNAYAALSDEDRQKVDNYQILVEANERFSDIAYAAIQDELAISDELFGSYFAQSYNTQQLESAIADAQKAINDVDEASYGNAYSVLKSENDAFQLYIDQQLDASYSMETYGGEYPFHIEESDLPEEWSFQPLVMQTSSHPNWVTSSREATDSSSYVNLFINGSSRRYTYEIEQIPTISITVQGDDGELTTALVNTKVQFTAAFNQAVNQDPNKELNERPAYLFVDKDSRILLALQDYDGNDYYVLYASYR